jgi:predicted DNA-binding transcriptional regulator YafY
MVALLQELEQSVAEGHTLSMDYQKGYETKSQVRDIDPYGLVYWKGKWYIVAYCHLRTEIRSFRVDRIHRLTRKEANFQHPEEFSARDFFLKFLLPDISDKEQLISVRISGKLHAIQDLCNHWLFAHVLVERTDEEVHLNLDRHALETVIPHFLLSYGRSIQILEPLSLKERVAAIASDIMKHHEAP